MSHEFDVIVVGARCAGAPVAMLLARKGRRVLLVDRATFPSDTISTHVVHPRASAALERWGLLDRLLETKCPAIDTYAFDFGPFTIEGEPGMASMPAAYCPRRTVLDKILVDAAAEAGVEVRQGFTVDEITAQGIADAFRDAEACASAVDEALDHARPFEAVMAEYQAVRDEHAMPMYEFTTQLATLAPPSPEMQQMFSSIVGNRDAMNAFVRMNAGTISPAEFFGSLAH